MNQIYILIAKEWIYCKLMITITASNHTCSLFISHCDMTRKIQADDFTVEKAEKT